MFCSSVLFQPIQNLRVAKRRFIRLFWKLYLEKNIKEISYFKYAKHLIFEQNTISLSSFEFKSPLCDCFTWTQQIKCEANAFLRENVMKIFITRWILTHHVAWQYILLESRCNFPNWFDKRIVRIVLCELHQNIFYKEIITYLCSGFQFYHAKMNEIWINVKVIRYYLACQLILLVIRYIFSIVTVHLQYGSVCVCVIEFIWWYLGQWTYRDGRKWNCTNGIQILTVGNDNWSLIPLPVHVTG